MTHKIELPAWPTASVRCGLCGRDIVYMIYREGWAGDKAQRPRYCPGHCREVARVRQAREKMKKHANRKQKEAQVGLCFG